MKRVKIGLLSLSILAIGVLCYAAINAQFVNGSGTPFQLIKVTASATYVLGVCDNDICISATGIQDDGSTAASVGDYIIVCTGQAMDVSLAAGQKLYIPSVAGSSATFRGYDCTYSNTDGTKEVLIKCYGHGATLQVIKGAYIK